ncbi:hypothetical protein SMSRO_SF026400 [Spiroplasma poulsonii]|uniref:Uncharacterized protein n=1 Tax=Spiroplasma poulsonii TaxID=2138 RepID=A0A2P6F9N9_9MOLU|nr:hypothetical protein SMSRO_SF026400 [Spiroplasma poulsonii]
MLLEDLNLLESGYSQVDKVNFPNIFTINTKEITNDIKTLDTFKTNGLPENIMKTLMNLEINLL